MSKKIYTMMVTERFESRYILEAESEEEARRKAEQGLFIDVIDHNFIEVTGDPEDWEIIEVEDVEDE